MVCSFFSGLGTPPTMPIDPIAGHMDARMVEYYSHIGSNVKRKAVERIGETYESVAQLLGIADGESARIN